MKNSYSGHSLSMLCSPVRSSDGVVCGVPDHDLDGPVPEHIHLGKECVVGDAAEEVSLAHVLRDDPVDELLQEHFEGVRLRAGVTETPLLGSHIELPLRGGQELLVVDPHNGDFVQLTPLVGLDELAGVLNDGVHKDCLDSRVKAAPVGHCEVSEDDSLPYEAKTVT